MKELNEFLRYNYLTGKLFWKKSPSNSVKAGQEIKSTDSKGYISFKFKGKSFLGHRVAWGLYHGWGFDLDIDHINHDRSDNRIDNLRMATKSENSRNASKRKDNTSGVSGVSWHKRYKKWCAKVYTKGKINHLGMFDDINDAEKSVNEFRVNNGFHENHGC